MISKNKEKPDVQVFLLCPFYGSSGKTIKPPTIPYIKASDSD